MTSMRILSAILFSLTPAAALAQPPAPAPPPACAPVFAASEKQITTPYHVYTTQTRDGVTRTGEIISMSDAQYLLVQGQWMRSPLSVSAQEALAQHRERLQTATVVSCTKVRSEAVDGLAAVVYQMHSETEEGISDGQMWIATKTGLPMRQEVDLQVLVGPPGKVHTSARFGYTDVRTPAVAP